MDAAVIAQFLAGAQFVQSKIVETMTIAGVDYDCSQSEDSTFDLTFEQGGASDALKAAVIALKNNLPIAPARNTPVTFRGELYRVTLVRDLILSWEIHLIQQFA